MKFRPPSSFAFCTNNGEVAYVIDAESNRTGYSYDGHDRLAKTEYPSATKGANAVNASDYEQLGYDANGNVTARRLRDGNSIGYAYDNLDRLVSKDLPSEEPDAPYSYDVVGRAASAVQNGQTLGFTHDALGCLGGLFPGRAGAARDDRAVAVAATGIVTGGLTCRLSPQSR